MVDIHQLNTRLVGEAARYLTAFRVTLLGATARIPPGNKNLVIARFERTVREITIRVKSRRSGSWQIPITEGCSPETHVDENEFWALVDFTVSTITPDFYIMPGKWLRNDIYRNYLDYLAFHGGQRPVTPKSTHHSLAVDRIEQWKERWDILS
jgi:hypothetical protein